jgi:monoamine oxidase
MKPFAGLDPRRRHILLAGAASVATATSGLGTIPASAASVRLPQGGFVGEAQALGHRLRDGGGFDATLPSSTRTVALAIIGAGVAGLAAARAAHEAGIDDLLVLDLHEQAGGNSRGHRIGTGPAARPCPLGAHYLPLPGPGTRELFDWCHEIGLLRHESGRTVPDDRHLCHAPQERLFFEGAWHEGLLPPALPGSPSHRQYVQFARWVDQARHELGFSLPTRHGRWTAGHADLDRQTFSVALAARGLDDSRLLSYLDYCCRDEYGAGADVISAWSGLHYFASRHGLHIEGADTADDERDRVFTWPEGNAWLVQRLAVPLGDRLLLQRLVRRVQALRHGVWIEAWNAASGRHERIVAQRAIVAVPLHVATRIVAPSLDVLRQAAAAAPQAAWLVANLALDRLPLARPGLPLAWDNVRFGSGINLGYVYAGHQNLTQDLAPPWVFTAYTAWPHGGRHNLLEADRSSLLSRVLAELELLHPDLPRQVVHADLTRHGHAMSIPVPGVRSHAALRTLAEGRADTPRLHWAHADLAGYSVFEEAFIAGCQAGKAAAQALHRGPSGR